jgi:tetratricopeptide (TPR) repeat protein
MFQADYYIFQFNKEANLKAKQLYREAIDLEPEDYYGYGGLAFGLIMDVHLGLSRSPRDSLGEAFKLCQKSISLDESQDTPHSMLGHIYSLGRKFDKAIAEGERAIELNPNSWLAYNWLGRTLTYAGRPEEAIVLLEKAARLNPNPVIRCKLTLGNAYREAGQYDRALSEYNKCIRNTPKNVFAHQGLVMTYALADRYSEARESYSELLKLDPNMTVEKMFRVWPYGLENRKHKIAAMHKAEIK